MPNDVLSLIAKMQRGGPRNSLASGLLSGNPLIGQLRANALAPVTDAYAESFNSKLTPAQEADYFLRWKQQNAPNDSGYDYDLRGAYLATLANSLVPSDQAGHFDDQFKKPIHPTYSQFSTIKDPRGLAPGYWGTDANGKRYFIPGPANLAYHSIDELRDYFRQAEPNALLSLK